MMHVVDATPAVYTAPGNTRPKYRLICFIRQAADHLPTRDRLRVDYSIALHSHAHHPGRWRCTVVCGMAPLSAQVQHTDYYLC